MANFFDLAEEVIDSVVYEHGEDCEKNLITWINQAKLNGDITVGEADYLRESVRGAIGRFGKDALRNPVGAVTKRAGDAANALNNKTTSAYANTIGKNPTADKVAKATGKVVGKAALSPLKAIPAAASTPANLKLKKMEKSLSNSPEDMKKLEIQRQKVKDIRKKVMTGEMTVLTVLPATPIVASAVAVAEKICGDREVSSTLVDAISAVGKKWDSLTKEMKEKNKDKKTAKEWEHAVNGTGKYGDGIEASLNKKLKSVITDLDNCMDKLAKSDMSPKLAAECAMDLLPGILEASEDEKITDEERDLLLQFTLKTR